MEAELVRLARMTDDHLAATCRWLRGSPELRRQVDCLEAPTEEGNVAHWHARWSETNREDYAIRVDQDGHVGNCGLCNIDRQRRKAELWIYLGAGRGTGRGSAAVRQLLVRAFDELHLNRVYLRVVSDNPRALGFYERLGFVLEGRFRQDTIHDGNPVDSIWMAMLASERPPAGPDASET